MLGNELKIERIRLQLKAKEVASQINITPQQLCNLERANTLPGVKYILFLRSHGVDLNNLFCSLQQLQDAPALIKYVTFLRIKGVDINALIDRVFNLKI